MVSSINSSLLNYLSNQGLDSAALNGKATTTKTAAALPQAALQRAAGMAKAASGVQALETAQQKLATDMRAAMAKAGFKLTGAVDFSVSSDGTVNVKGSDADKAAVKAFFKADASQPNFATRIAGQAKDAIKLSESIQQSAAISQAAKLAKTSGGVLSLYASLMQQQATNVTFTLSPSSSTLTYPGSLTANA